MKVITKKIDDITVHLHKGCDMVHGRGWFCQCVFADYTIGFGFSKNKFTAVRKAIKKRVK